MHGRDLEALLNRLADIADALTLPAWKSDTLQVEFKPDGSPVTATDVAVETQVRALLRELCPDDAFVGEEVGEAVGTSGRTWIVDGIDGTRAFTTGRAEWSTLIGLVDNDQLVAGMVTSPALARRWHTRPDGNAVLVSPDAAPQPLSVSSQSSLADASIISWPVSGVVKPKFEPHANRLLELTSGESVRPSWNSGMPNGAMLVAEGKVDGFVMFGGQGWDHAASAAVLTAAGGRFSSVTGSASLWQGSGVYSNSNVHEALIEQLL